MKRTTIILLTLCALLCGCAGERNAALPVTEQTDANTFAPELLPAAENANEWTLADFPGCFDGEWETAREEITLGEDLSVTVLCGEADGPAVYVVAGVHGDETAGWRVGTCSKMPACGRERCISSALPMLTARRTTSEKRRRSGI